MNDYLSDFKQENEFEYLHRTKYNQILYVMIPAYTLNITMYVSCGIACFRNSMDLVCTVCAYIICDWLVPKVIHHVWPLFLGQGIWMHHLWQSMTLCIFCDY